MAIPTQTGNGDRPVWLQRAIDKFNEEPRPDGDVLTNEWLVWALDVPAPKTLAEYKDHSFTLMSRVEAFKDWLMTERKIVLRNVRGTGYQIVPPSEQALFAAETWVKAIEKGAKKSIAYLTNARTEDLTAEERKRHIDTEIRIRGASDILTKEKRNVFLMFQPNKVKKPT